MCGILGVVRSHDQKVDGFDATFDAALQLIHHRGPDASGVYHSDRVSFGHKRLSILDVSDAGSQPMVTSDEQYALTYNGEIYNYKELIEEFNLKELKSSGDTEVLFRLLQKYGAEIIPKLNGMFAFAFYDKKNATILIARDRAGIKPIYYSSSALGIQFSSEIKALEKIVGHGAGVENHKLVDSSALHEWAYYGVALGDKTLYENVKRILPGHYLEISTTSRAVEIKQYWNPMSWAGGGGRAEVSHVSHGNRSDSNLETTTRELLEKAVCRQLVSDVPVGIFLSGGIDSSAIAAFAVRNSEKKLSTFSVGFDFDKGVNELPVAKKFAAELGTDHHEMQIKGADLPDIVEKMVFHHDQPFSDSANIPLYLLCKELDGQVKVVLQGDGGDELFGGYKRYKTVSNLKFARVLAQAYQYAKFIVPKNKKYYVGDRYSRALLDNSLAGVFARLLTVEYPERSPAGVFSGDYRRKLEAADPFERYRVCQKNYESLSPTDQLLLVDFQIILPDIFLEKVDKSTMAASVEARVPFLDNELVEHCHRLTAEEKIPKGQQKWLLKKSLEGIVANEILYGPKKGFSVPYGYWLRTSLSDFFNDHMSTFMQNNHNVVSRKEVEKLLEENKTGSRDNSFILWKLLNLFIWCNKNKVDFGVPQ